MQAIAWAEFATLRKNLLKIGARVVERAARIRARAGLHDVRIHDIRHSCASWPDFLAAKEVIKRCNWLSFSLLPKPPYIAIYNPKPAYP